MINAKKRTKLATLLGAAFIGITALSASATRKIQPLGWYDFNGDNVQDAIVTQNWSRTGDERNGTIRLDELAWVDGNSIYTNTKTVTRNDWAEKQTDYFCKRPLFSILSLNTPIIESSPDFPPTAARIRKNGNSLDLELYTQISEEPTARVDVFYNVN